MSIKEDRWNKIFRKLTKDLTPKQALVCKIIFETACNMEVIFLPTMSCDEIVITTILKTHSHGKRIEEDVIDRCSETEEYYIIIDKLLEKKGKEVKDIIEELCAKDFVSCHMIRFGDEVKEKPIKVLVVRDYYRRILMQAMTEKYDPCASNL